MAAQLGLPQQCQMVHTRQSPQHAVMTLYPAEEHLRMSYDVLTEKQQSLP